MNEEELRSTIGRNDRSVIVASLEFVIFIIIILVMHLLTMINKVPMSLGVSISTIGVFVILLTYLTDNYIINPLFYLYYLFYKLGIVKANNLFDLVVNFRLGSMINGYDVFNHECSIIDREVKDPYPISKYTTKDMLAVIFTVMAIYLFVFSGLIALIEIL